MTSLNRRVQKLETKEEFIITTESWESSPDLVDEASTPSSPVISYYHEEQTTKPLVMNDDSEQFEADDGFKYIRLWADDYGISKAANAALLKIIHEHFDPVGVVTIEEKDATETNQTALAKEVPPKYQPEAIPSGFVVDHADYTAHADKLDAIMELQRRTLELMKSLRKSDYSTAVAASPLNTSVEIGTLAQYAEVMEKLQTTDYRELLRATFYKQKYLPNDLKMNQINRWFSDEVLGNFNWSGKYNKNAIKDNALFNLIRDAWKSETFSNDDWCKLMKAIIDASRHRRKNKRRKIEKDSSALE